jgi:S1-C subfamily serine protease
MKHPKNEQYNDPWERDWYETGSTRPPKDHGGLIAVLLMLVIFLGGAATLMGVMNIRLFQMLEAQQRDKEAYLYADGILATQATDPRQEDSGEVTVDLLGMKGQTVSKFDRRFFQLPQGYLVTDLKEESVAQQAGIRTGDVIVAVQDQQIASSEALSAVLEQLQPGQSADVRVYRRQLEQEIEMTVVIPEDRP